MASEAGLRTDPPADLLVVDRRAWIGGNVRTLRETFGETLRATPDLRVLAWEGGVFLGLLARAVLAQYDPFRDLLVVVYPNLGQLAGGEGLRWLVLHEVTHLGQFRQAPWLREHVISLGRRALELGEGGWLREAAGRLVRSLPAFVRRARDVVSGRGDGITPLLDLLPPAQRETVLELHALLTLLEGHATYVTDRVAARLIPDYPALQERIRERRSRRGAVRVLEAVAGLEMKRQQYVLGRGFCEAVWRQGGAEALAEAWRSPQGLPTLDELRDPARWMARVRAAG